MHWAWRPAGWGPCAVEWTEAADERRLNKLLNALSKVDLPIVGDLSYLTINRTKSELLFQGISKRSERTGVIVSGNLAFAYGTALFEKDRMVSALVDRLTCRSYTLDRNIPDSGRFSLNLKERGTSKKIGTIHPET